MGKPILYAIIFAWLAALTPTVAEARPKAWCGWWLRQELGVAPAKYNLARSWYQWGNASSARVGAVVVWPHHVGVIVGREHGTGKWLIRSGNDSGGVRTRSSWNLKGARFRYNG